MGEIECTKCGVKSTLKDPKNPVFPCDSCRRYFCGDCSKLNPSEIKCMPIQRRTLIFHCLECREGHLSKLFEKKILEEIRKTYETFEKELSKKFFEELEKVQEAIEKRFEKNQEETVHQLTTEIKSLHNDTKANISYSSVTQIKPKVNEVLVVKPKKKQDSKTTKIDLKQKIDPKEMAIAVENIKETKGGAVIINCGNNSTKEKIKEKVENELKNYNVEEAVQKNPKIIIIGVEDEYVEGTDEMVLDAIKEQNDLRSEEFMVLKKYKQVGKRNKGNIILSVKNVTLKEKICQEGRINIGWRRCFVQEFFSVIRCFKCARYGHMAAKCENRETCFKCAGSHKTNDCDSTVLKCINCSEANTKYKKTIKVDHKANDSGCECYKRLVNLEVKKTKSQ